MRLALALAALLALHPVLAAETPWQELAPDTRIRLIASEQLQPGGRTHVALELEMPPGTKTYWKVPGETGIPLELDFTGSENIRPGRAVWPFPQVELVAGYTDFVHYGHVVIPIELEAAGDAATVTLNTLMGICSDICVPAQASFALPLDFSSPDTGQALRIQQALTAAPLPWTSAEPPIGEVRYDAAAETLSVAVDPTRLDPASLIVDASTAGYVFGAPQKSPETNLVTYDLLGGSAATALAGKAVTFVFMTPDGPFEVERVVVAEGR